MKNVLKLVGIIALVAVIGFSLAACGGLFGDKDKEGGTEEVPGGNGDGTGGNGGSGGGSTTGNTREKAIEVTVGYSSSYTISSSGQHWFKFTGTGDPVIFETRGDVVDTYIEFYQGDSTISITGNDDSGEGSNALLTRTGTSGTTYFIKVTARRSTSGTYTFVVSAPTSNLRTNPITVSVGNSSSHIINSSGQHWFRFTGTGDRVFFETESKAVDTDMSLYIGDSTNSIYSKREKKGINFITVSGTTYYIKVTGNSGTYTFNVFNGTGDGSSRYNAQEVSKGYSSSYTITSSGQHWFIYQGTGESVTFKTEGNVVDTYIELYGGDSSISSYQNDNSGEGSNALLTRTATSGTTYLIKITARSSTSGTYTFVVE